MTRPLALAFLSLLIPSGALAQSPFKPPRPSFEVASVKPATLAPGQRPAEAGCTPATGRYVAPGRGLWFSIGYAYNTQLYQLSGMPAWSSGRNGLYDIEGKVGGPITESQCREMVQSLLADRFKLTVHREMKPLAVLAMVVAKNGAKIRKKTESDTGNLVKINGVPGYGGQNGWTMPQLAEFLARNFPGQVVVDRTGLEGLYKITLDYEILPGSPPGDAVFAEIPRQLGLKLELRKESIETIVVDRLERAGDN